MPVRIRTFVLAALVAALVIGAMPLSTVSATVAPPSAPAPPAQQLAVPVVIVNTSFLHLRSGPGGMYSVIAVLPGGTQLPVIGRNRDDSWWQVQSLYGIGWVSAEFVIPRGDFTPVPIVEAPGVVEQALAVVPGAPVSVYSFPSTSAGLLGLALGGSQLPVSGRTADGVWWQVQTNVGTGYVRQADVSLRGNAATVPIVAPAQPAPQPVVIVPAPSTTTTTIQVPVQLTTVNIPTVSTTQALYVRFDTTEVKELPQEGSPTLDYLDSGERVYFIMFSSARDFVRVRYRDIREGWIATEELRFEANDPRTQVVYNRPGVLSLRTIPDPEGPLVANVPPGESMAVVDAILGGSWLLLEHSSLGTGWAPAEAVEVIREGDPALAQQPGTTIQIPVQPITTTTTTVVVPQAQPVAVVPSAPPQIQLPIVVVNTGFQNVRSGPGGQFTVLTTVSGGTELTVVGVTPDVEWYQVQGFFGIGWVDSEFVLFRGDPEIVPVIPYEQATGSVAVPQAVVAAPVNVFLAPDVTSGLLGTATAGSALPVVGRTADWNWLQVQTTAGFGWVLTSTVTFRGDASIVPIVG